MNAVIAKGCGLIGLVFLIGGVALVTSGQSSGWMAMGFGVLIAQFAVVNFWPRRVPVVMFHSIAGWREDRPETFSIWHPPHIFEGYLKYLRRRGYESITLEQLHAHQVQGSPLPRKPIVLTFDDGYLDNWVYAAPLLRKYGFSGTIFMSSDFIEPGEQTRPTMDDVRAGRVEESQLEVFGHLNQAEMRALVDQGTFEFHSHGQTHTWLPKSERVIDYNRPGIPLGHLRWMWWNRHPEQKPFWFARIDASGVPWGAPVYEYRLALAGPAVKVDPGLERTLVDYVQDRGGESFFVQSDWRTQLDAQVSRYRRERPAEAAEETDEEFRARLRAEFVNSRERIEAITGKPVRFLCWPNGGTCKQAFEELQASGYHAATLPSRYGRKYNHANTDPSRIGRVSATSFFRGTQKALPWVISFALKLERSRGNTYMELPIKAIWLWRRVFAAKAPTPPSVVDRA